MRPDLGIHRDIPFAEYCSWDAMNSSTLNAGMQTMAHLGHRIKNPQEDTKATTIGRATHTLVLEPTKFESNYIILPEGDRRKKENKEAYQAALDLAANTGKEVMTRKDFKEAASLADSVRDNPMARELIESPGDREICVAWEDPDTGVLCKGRIDIFVSWNNYSVVADLKTTISAGKGSFARSVHKYNYHIQAAMYKDALAVISKMDGRRFFWIAIEKTPPYLVAFYEPANEVLEHGRMLYKKILQQYSDCRDNDNYPGYREDIIQLALPAYAYADTGPEEADDE